MKPSPLPFPSEPLEPAPRPPELDRATFGAIRVRNSKTVARSGWIFVGVAREILAQLATAIGGNAGWMTDGDKNFPCHIVDEGVRVWVSIPAGIRLELAFLAQIRTPQPFAFHPIVAENWLAIAPRLFVDGSPSDPGRLIVTEFSESSLRARIEYVWPTRKLSAFAFVDLSSTFAPIDVAIQFVYGTTANDRQFPIVAPGRVTVRSRARIVRLLGVDFGFGAPVRLPSGEWEAVVLPAGVPVLRAGRVPARLIIDPLDQELDEPLRFGVWSEWQNRFVGSGVVQKWTVDTGADLLNLQRTRVRVNSLHALRPLGQQPNAGQTGEQEDFGYGSWLPHLYQQGCDSENFSALLIQAQSFELRPTGNREPDGSVMRADAHPNAETYNQRVDLSLGRGDRLGWPSDGEDPRSPFAMPYLPNGAWPWSTLDDQHTATNLAFAVFALTRDAAIESVLRDMHELDRTDTYVRTPRWITPRAMARTTLHRLNRWRFLPDLRAQTKTIVEQTLDRWIAESPIGREGSNATAMKSWASNNVAKYGWNWIGTTSPIVGGATFEEGLQDVACYLAGRILGRSDWLNVARRGARWLAWAFREDPSGRLLHAYAFRWQNGANVQPEQWPTAAQLRPDGEGNTNEVYVSGAADYWNLGAMLLLTVAERAELLPSGFAARLLAAPQNEQEASWWAL
jgi:hypothetical protein